jgi:hypothetical protein
VEFWITGSSAILPLPFRLGSAETPLTLKYTDTVRVGFEWVPIIAGRHELTAILILRNDAKRGNDTLRASIAVGHRRNTVLINEIMYAPPANQSEWIEIFNPQSTARSLADWQLEDEDENRGVLPSGVMIPPLGIWCWRETPRLPAPFVLPILSLWCRRIFQASIMLATFCDGVISAAQSLILWLIRKIGVLPKPLPKKSGLSATT